MRFLSLAFNPLRNDSLVSNGITSRVIESTLRYALHIKRCHPLFSFSAKRVDDLPPLPTNTNVTLDIISFFLKLVFLSTLSMAFKEN